MRRSSHKLRKLASSWANVLKQSRISTDSGILSSSNFCPVSAACRKLSFLASISPKFFLQLQNKKKLIYKYILYSPSYHNRSFYSTISKKFTAKQYSYSTYSLPLCSWCVSSKASAPATSFANSFDEISTFMPLIHSHNSR